MAEETVLSRKEYLIFEIGKHRYGAPLEDLSEIIEKPEFCKVPNSIDGFLGLTNLRGELIACVDLSHRIHQNSEESVEGKLIIAFNNGMKMGTLVDRIVAVESIESEDLDQDTAIKTGIDEKYLMGISKVTSPPTILVHLAKLLSEKELIQMEDISKEASKAS